MRKTFKKWLKRVPWKALLLLCGALILILIGSSLIWVSTFKIPDLAALQAKALSQSTKIYDKTGKILLYDLNPNLKRTVVPFDEISQPAKDAAVAIEDDQFYSHNGVRPLAFLRAMFYDLLAGEYAQGGSTITQQVIKNTLLTNDKTITRKVKEWVLAIRLEQIADKKTILNLYLNTIPYGGSLYGIEEASQAFFAKPAAELDIAESAYLAAIPQAPTRYSPFGKNLNLLEARKNLVLQRMLDNKFITQDQFASAKAEKVAFQSGLNQSIKAPHFVMYVRQYLEDKYGADLVESGGLKVISTLDYGMEQVAEQVAKDYATKNAVTYNASNAAVVIIDPKTGNILSMVGSRDYFDKKIDGNFNVATAENRQPGSTFKPFVYAAGFNKGYTPETVLFDTKTQFSSTCAYNDPSNVYPCYSPGNFDDTFRGPITVRNALGNSINVPAVKMMYLVGTKDALKLSSDMGITSLGDPSQQYGLTLVLGGGSVSLLEMTSAYSVFANNGVRNPYNSILSIQDSFGNTLESYTPSATTVLPEQTALQITDILSDNQARAGEYGLTSPLNIPGYDVAAKTGTTNNYVDAWVIGYTPNIVVGAWAGNNNNTPMEKKIAGYIVAPLWRAIMDKVLPMQQEDSFTKPDPLPTDLKPVLRGIWQGSVPVITNQNTATSTDQTQIQPVNSGNKFVSGVHDILYWVSKSDPLGPQPIHPENDPQFAAWEYGVQQWLMQNGYTQINDYGQVIPPFSTGTVSTTTTP